MKTAWKVLAFCLAAWGAGVFAVLITSMVWLMATMWADQATERAAVKLANEGRCAEALREAAKIPEGSYWVEKRCAP